MESGGVRLRGGEAEACDAESGAAHSDAPSEEKTRSSYSPALRPWATVLVLVLLLDLLYQGYYMLAKDVHQAEDLDACLLNGNQRTLEELNAMSQEDKRRAAITFLHYNSRVAIMLLHYNGGGSMPDLQDKGDEEINQLCLRQAVLASGYAVGDRVVFVEADRTFPSGNVLARGHEGVIRGPDSEGRRNKLRVLWDGNKGDISVFLSSISMQTSLPPPWTRDQEEEKLDEDEEPEEDLDEGEESEEEEPDNSEEEAPNGLRQQAAVEEPQDGEDAHEEDQEEEHEVAEEEEKEYEKEDAEEDAPEDEQDREMVHEAGDPLQGVQQARSFNIALAQEKADFERQRGQVPQLQREQQDRTRPTRGPMRTTRGSSVVIVFQDQDGAEKTFTFWERPVGFNLMMETPPVVSRVTDEGFRSGLKVGMKMLKFNDVDATKVLDWRSFERDLMQGMRKLPMKPAVAVRGPKDSQHDHHGPRPLAKGQRDPPSSQANPAQGYPTQRPMILSTATGDALGHSHGHGLPHRAGAKQGAAGEVGHGEQRNPHHTLPPRPPHHGAPHRSHHTLPPRNPHHRRPEAKAAPYTRPDKRKNTGPRA